jgi:hypothetical protein
MDLSLFLLNLFVSRGSFPKRYPNRCSIYPKIQERLEEIEAANRMNACGDRLYNCRVSDIVMC